MWISSHKELFEITSVPNWSMYYKSVSTGCFYGYILITNNFEGL